MNIDKIKKEFPIFDEKIQNNDLVYLDSANSSQKPKIVLYKIHLFYPIQLLVFEKNLSYLNKPNHCSEFFHQKLEILF